MKPYKSWLSWLIAHPVAMLNVAVILLIISLFTFQLFRPLDVLENWNLELTEVKEYRIVGERKLAVYHPGDTLLFTSTSNKLQNVEGNATRSLVCEQTEQRDEQEILLDTIPVNKKAGEKPKRDNAVFLPDVAQYNGLPRVCRFEVNILYQNVALWRSHPESASTEPFIIEELRLSPEQVQKQIQELNDRIKELEEQTDVVRVDKPNVQTSPQVVNQGTPQSEVPAPTPAQPQSPQPSAQQPQQTLPTQREERKGLLERLVAPVDNLLKEIL